MLKRLLAHKIMLLQIPFVILFTLAFHIDELGVKGELHNVFLRETVLPLLRRVTALHTDLKFKMRGPQAPKNKIVVVEIDGNSIEELGRWPWDRDKTAKLLEAIFKYEPKAVGLDIYFSEPQKKVGDDVRALLASVNLAAAADAFEGDPVLAQTIATHSDRLVLGHASEAECQPAYTSPEECPVTNPDAIATHPQGFDKFAFQRFDSPVPFDQAATPFNSLVTILSNIQPFNDAAKHGGFVLVFPADPDANIRRLGQFVMANGKPYPSLALEMARVGLNDELELKLDANQRVQRLGFVKSGKTLPVSPLGVLQPNFRGPAQTFQYIQAADLLKESDKLESPFNRKLAGISKLEALRDAYVFVGITAVGLHDLKSMPFDSRIPGVELHANVLDNILSDDAMVAASATGGTLWIFLLMTLGAIAFASMTEKLQAVPALILFVAVFSGLGLADLKLLFARGQSWNTSFLMLEIGTIFIFTLALKYVMEERSKKFLKAAFTKYVSPALVSELIKNPEKLSLGGEKRELTIMFSDIRSFTTFSEKMDAKALAGFLNDYLSTMTNLVFEHEGTLDKYIGDAVMAFWGAPLESNKHAANACKAAVAMMKALKKEQKRYKETYGIDVDIGVGINSGNVNVGNMGSANNFEYTVIGDSVNLASRLEGLTKPYGCSILTTRFTLDDITAAGEPLPAHRVIDFVKVKGKKKAVEIIHVFHNDMDAEGLRIFEEGRVLYTQQKWDAAIEKFTQSAQILAEGDKADGPSEMYVERCREFKITPPGDAWDGSWEMHSK